MDTLKRVCVACTIQELANLYERRIKPRPTDPDDQATLPLPDTLLLCNGAVDPKDDGEASHRPLNICSACWCWQVCQQCMAVNHDDASNRLICSQCDRIVGAPELCACAAIVYCQSVYCVCRRCASDKDVAECSNCKQDFPWHVFADDGERPWCEDAYSARFCPTCAVAVNDGKKWKW